MNSKWKLFPPSWSRRLLCTAGGRATRPFAVPPTHSTPSFRGGGPSGTGGCGRGLWTRSGGTQRGSCAPSRRTCTCGAPGCLMATTGGWSSLTLTRKSSWRVSASPVSSTARWSFSTRGGVGCRRSRCGARDGLYHHRGRPPVDRGTRLPPHLGHHRGRAHVLPAAPVPVVHGLDRLVLLPLEAVRTQVVLLKAVERPDGGRRVARLPRCEHKRPQGGLTRHFRRNEKSSQR
jgi:hypothetical protein